MQATSFQVPRGFDQPDMQTCSKIPGFGRRISDLSDDLDKSPIFVAGIMTRNEVGQMVSCRYGSRDFRSHHRKLRLDCASCSNCGIATCWEDLDSSDLDGFDIRYLRSDHLRVSLQTRQWSNIGSKSLALASPRISVEGPSPKTQIPRVLRKLSKNLQGELKVWTFVQKCGGETLKLYTDPQ